MIDVLKFFGYEIKIRFWQYNTFVSKSLSPWPIYLTYILTFACSTWIRICCTLQLQWMRWFFILFLKTWIPYFLSYSSSFYEEPVYCTNMNKLYNICSSKTFLLYLVIAVATLFRVLYSFICEVSWKDTSLSIIWVCYFY